LKRDLSDKLKAWGKNPKRKPLLLKGARQVGKTYSLKRFGADEFAKHHYINLEADESLGRIFEKNLRPARILAELGFYLETTIRPDSELLILDEIQACPKALTALKYFQEELPGMAVCAAGSLLGVHLGDSAFPVGKVDHLDMYPMSFREFLAGCGNARLAKFIHDYDGSEPLPQTLHDRFWEQLKYYFITGGLPEIIGIFADMKQEPYAALQAVRTRQAQLAGDYMADIAKHSGKQNATHIERIWKSVPAQLARQVNGSSAKYRFKGVVPGVHTYSKLVGALDWLAAAGLNIKVPIANNGLLPFSAYNKENKFKLFCFDVGMLGAISSLAPKTIWDYEYGSYKGYFAENFVAQQLLGAGAGPIYAWHENRAEVEFIVEDRGRVLPIEVKSGWVTQAKSLKVFAEKYNPEYRSVFSAKNVSIDHQNRIHHYPLYLAERFPLF